MGLRDLSRWRGGKSIPGGAHDAESSEVTQNVGHLGILLSKKVTWLWLAWRVRRRQVREGLGGTSRATWVWTPEETGLQDVVALVKR